MRREIASDVVALRTRRFRVAVGPYSDNDTTLVWDAFAETPWGGFYSTPVRPVEKIPLTVARHGEQMIAWMSRVKGGT